MTTCPNLFRTIAGILILAITSLFLMVTAANGQRRDYMTEEEIELVRDAQDIDLRITVLTRMIDRRFTALGIDAGGWKQREKDDEKWGPGPTGSRAELFSDIRRLLEKAVDDLDVIAQRNEDALKQNQVNGDLFPYAVGLLENAAMRYAPILAREAEKAGDERTRVMILASGEHCSDIISAAAKIAPEAKQKRKRSKTDDESKKPN